MNAMKMTRTLVLLIAAAAVLVGTAAQPAGALTTLGAQAQLRQNAAKLAAAQAKIAAAKHQESSLAAAVGALDAKLGVIGDQLAPLQAKVAIATAKLDASQARLDQLRAQLATKRQALDKAQADLAQQQQLFGEHVVEIYKTGDVSYLDMLLGATGYDDFISRLQVVSRIVSNDNQIAADLDSARAKVQAQEDAVAADTAAAFKIQQGLKAQHDQLAAVEAELAAKQASYAAARQQKNATLAQVQTSSKAWEQQQAQLHADSARLQAFLSGRSTSSNSYATGSMMWPVSGPITSPFGWRTSPFGGSEFHTGIDIGVPYGTPIHAADGGNVVWAQWMGGYGNAVVIDHGGGLSTLYGHQSSLNVSVGQGVTRGQVIGYVGSTGMSTGPHLHFEVRLNGKPVNPLGYLK